MAMTLREFFERGVVNFNISINESKKKRTLLPRHSKPVIALSAFVFSLTQNLFKEFLSKI